MNNKMGLVVYSSDNEFMKPYSEQTNEDLDEEIKRVVDECYQSTKELLESKRDLIEK